MTRGMKKLLKELGLRQDFPTVERSAIKERVNTALNATPSERRNYMRQKIRMTAVLVATIIALCGTAFAVFRFHFLGAYYKGDTQPMEEYIVHTSDSITDGVFTVRVEGAVTDQFTTIVGLSIHSENIDALSELCNTENEMHDFPKYRNLLSFRGTALSSSTASTRRTVSVQYQRLQQYDTEDTIYLSVRITGVTGALYIGFREAGANTAILEVPLEKQVEVMEIYPTLSALENGEYRVDRIALSLMGLKLEISFPQPRKSSDPDFILPFYLRMADGSIQTPPQFFNKGTPWKNISLIRENADGSCTYLYSAPTEHPVDLLSVSGIIIQGMEYSFQVPNSAVPMEVDEALVPFLTPFVEIDEFFYVSAKEVCQRLKAALSIAPDSKTATIVYRDITIEFEIGSTSMIVNGVPCEIDGGKTRLQDGALLVSSAVWDYIQVGVKMYFSEPGNANIPPKWWLITP